MSYQSPKIEIVSNNIVRVYHPDPIEPVTQLTATVAATGTSLTVANNAGFSNTDPQSLLLFEGYGNENAEIKRVNGAITLGTSLTSQAVTFAHNIDCSIQRVLFNQVEISGASTLTGSKTVIATVDINVSGPQTDYIVTGTTYSYYFARYYNSLSTTTYYGDYSDGVVSTDFEVNTVGFIRRTAILNIGEDYNRYPPNWIYDQIYACEQDLVYAKPKWGRLVIYNHDMGNLATGDASTALPSNIADAKTNKSIISCRIATELPMIFIERPEFEVLTQGVAQTTLASTASIGATSFVLTDSNDFANSGTVNIAGTEYSYTTNTRSTDTLSGITAIAAEITSGANVWQNVTFGEPIHFTVSAGYIYYDIPPSSSWNGRNVWIDYIKGATKPNSDGDTVIFDDPLVYIYWLEMAMKKEKANGVLAADDFSLLQYNDRKKTLITTDKLPGGLNIVPSIPGFYRSGWKWYER